MFLTCPCFAFCLFHVRNRTSPPQEWPSCPSCSPVLQLYVRAWYIMCNRISVCLFGWHPGLLLHPWWTCNSCQAGSCQKGVYFKADHCEIATDYVSCLGCIIEHQVDVKVGTSNTAVGAVFLQCIQIDIDKLHSCALISPVLCSPQWEIMVSETGSCKQWDSLGAVEGTRFNYSYEMITRG